MIRDATLADIPRMVEMGQHFRKQTSYDKFLSDSPETMKKLGETLIERNGLIVSEERGEVIGMLGFIIYEHFISGDLTAGEVFWFVEPQHRGSGIRLMKEMERRARSAGAKNMQMVAPSWKVAKFYKRSGFELMEMSYQRTL